MESTLTRNYINSLEEKLNAPNDLCTCNCDLDVFREMTKEHEKKLDELDKKFMPYRFETRFNIAYCKDCDSFYLIKTNYEASSKIDFEDIEFIYKKDYFEANDYIKKLETRYVDDNTHSIYVDKYIVRVLKHINNEKFSMRFISIEDISKANDYISNKKMCYNCFNKKIVPGNEVKCFKDYNNYNYYYVCDKFESIFEEEE